MPISSGRLPTSARSWRPNGSSGSASPDCPPSCASCRASCEARRVEWAKSPIQMKKFTASLAGDFAHTVIEPRGHDASCASLHVACTARPCPRCAMPTLHVVRDGARQRDETLDWYLFRARGRIETRGGEQGRGIALERFEAL